MARNKNLFKKSLIFAGTFVVILLAVMTFRYCGNRSAQNDINQADAAALNVQPGDTAAQQQVMDMYAKLAEGSYAPNMRAKLVTAIDKYGQGDYEGALQALDGFSSRSIIATVGVYCLTGDCYVNLDKNDEAIEQFNKALADAEGNEVLAPYVLNKLANVYHVTKDAKNETEVRERLMKEFPNYNPNADIEAEFERANAAQK